MKFHGTLSKDERVILDPAVGVLAADLGRAGNPVWKGQLILSPEAPIIAGEMYCLDLDDGRSATMQVNGIHADPLLGAIADFSLSAPPR